MSSNLGSISTGNIILQNSKGSLNFLNALSSAPQIGVIGSVFDVSFALKNNSDQFDTFLSGTGTVNRVKNYVVQTTPNSGDVSIFQSKQYIKTNCGANRIVTFVCALSVVQSVARVGSFDSSVQKTDSTDQSGFFFQYDGTTFSAVQRQSGTADAVVNQSAFNLDKLDGTGYSKYTLNPTATNMYVIVYDNSSVNVGIIFGGSVIFDHRFDNVNEAVSTLPIRFELANSSIANDASQLKVYSCGISSSTVQSKGIKRSIGLRASKRDILTQSTGLPVLSVRLTQAYARASAKITGLHLTSSTALYYEVVLNGVLAGAAFSATGSTVLTEMDRTATAITGGTVVMSGYINANGVTNIEIKDTLPLTSNIVGTCDIYSLNVICMVSSGVCSANVDIEEVF